MSRAGARRREDATLFAAAALVAVGGIIYELILGTAASYLVGDSVLSFSLATGVTLFGMGLGSLLVNHLGWEPATSFAVNEVLLGLVGGNSVLVLYLAFGYTRLHWVVFCAMSLVIGVLIGLEIPLLVKTFAAFGRGSSVELFSRVLAIDYFGALVASLVFPLLLLPQLGLMRGAYLVGAVNTLVAVLMLVQLRSSRKALAAAVAALVALTGLFLGANQLEHSVGAATYRDPVIYYDQSAYQKIVITKYGADLRLYLDNQLQFSSLDERRYHETLAGSALTSVEGPAHVLILGGGDGLLAREVLRYPSVQDITLVDIDPAVTTLARDNHLLREVNDGSLSSPRVHVVNGDAFQYVFDTTARYDAVLVDLVDPSNERLAKLYSQEFYTQAEKVLTDKGVMVTQATSSYFSPSAFATVASTVRAAQPGRTVVPFSVNVPSFGEWGFVLSTTAPEALASQPLPAGLDYQNHRLLDFILVQDPARTPEVEPSTLLHPRIVERYNSDMRQWRYY